MTRRNIIFGSSSTLAVVVAVWLCCCFSRYAAGELTPVEKQIREELGIPLDAPRVLILSQSGHLDWDWLNYFSTNYNLTPPDQVNYFKSNPKDTPQPVNVLFPQATELLASDKRYYYSICETAFLMLFAKHQNAEFQKMRATGRLRIVGGGITSPDSLLPSGEGFFRNYLVGVQWLLQNNLNWTGHLWVPDDFGHDSQLPVMAQALGSMSVSFTRIPGSCKQGPSTPPKNLKAASQLLLDRNLGGVDFTWKASDGSTTLAHFMENHYDQGFYIDKSQNVPNSPEDMSECKFNTFASTPQEFISSFINTNGPVSPTPYIYVPVSEDYAVPNPNLAAHCDDWNAKSYPSSKVYAVQATYDHYARLVTAFASASSQALRTRDFHGTTPETSFQPSPYWMGYYASRPELKTLHHAATKALIGAEIFGYIASAFEYSTLRHSLYQSAIDDAWGLVAPSTHHDYITGTATDYVYEGEQLPLSQTSFDTANALLSQYQKQIASLLPAPSKQSLVVFNQLGYTVQGLVEGPSSFPSLQKSANGNSLFLVQVPSLGYKVINTNNNQWRPKPKELRHVEDPDFFVLENQFLRVNISRSANWGISALIDKGTNKSILAAGKVGNTFSVFKEDGNIYRFGYEANCNFQSASLTITPSTATLVENGPLRYHLSAQVQIKPFGSSSETFVLEYFLVVGEPFLRMRLSGAAVRNSNVFVEFPFAEPITQFYHGTPYHFDYKTPAPYGTSSDFSAIFEATHDFVIPQNQAGSFLGALYHGGIPAWTVEPSRPNTLVGVLLRNTPGNCDGKGASGSDDTEHVQDYALRVPTGLKGPESGQPLMESRAFHTDLRARPLPNPHPTWQSGVPLPLEYSLASVSSGNGFLTVAKAGSVAPSNALILRFYQPTNQPQELVVSVNATFVKPQVSYTSALEFVESQMPASQIALQPTSISLKVDAPRAVTTIAIQNGKKF